MSGWKPVAVLPTLGLIDCGIFVVAVAKVASIYALCCCNLRVFVWKRCRVFSARNFSVNSVESEGSIITWRLNRPSSEG